MASDDHGRVGRRDVKKSESATARIVDCPHATIAANSSKIVRVHQLVVARKRRASRGSCWTLSEAWL